MKRITSITLLTGIGGVSLLGLFLADPIAQDPGYHRFADGRALLGVDEEAEQLRFAHVVSALNETLAANVLALPEQACNIPDTVVRSSDFLQHPVFPQPHTS